MPVIAGRNIGRNDLVVMAVGVLAFIDSLLPWYGVSVGNLSASKSAWGSGIGAWLPCLLMIFVAASVAARVFAGRNTGSVGQVGGTNVSWALLNLAVPVLAALIVLLRWVTYDDLGIGAGARFGTYLGLILAIVQAVFAFFSFAASGERLPWQKTNR